MEAVVALGFVVAAIIDTVYALGCIAVLWLGKLGPGLKALGALVSVKHRQPPDALLPNNRHACHVMDSRKLSSLRPGLNWHP